MSRIELAPNLRPELFRQAAFDMVTWAERDLVSAESRYCPLRSIVMPIKERRRTESWIENYVAKAYFTSLFRPDNQDPYKHWWDDGDEDGPVIALLLAALIVEDSE